MNDHEIDNVDKIDKINSADNEKVVTIDFYGYSRYEWKRDYRQLSIYRLVFWPSRGLALRKRR